MKKLLLMFMFFSLLVVCSVSAQNRTVSGKIIDETGESVPGANIIEKGTSNGTTTDSAGNFTISVSEGATLVFSFIGYATMEMPVGANTVLNVTLQSDIAELSEVVVIGYGTVKKSDLTGSVATIDTKEAFRAPVASLESGLQGRAAGVQVSSTDGQPGSSPNIIIRGGNSITGGNDPLYVIDGFVGAGNITSINPNDIESMQILKDASSTAIYGARGTNGVILITTKKGKIGKPVFNFQVSTGIQTLPAEIDVQNSREYASWVNDIAVDQNNLPFDLDNLPGGETNWQDVMTQSAPLSDYQLSVGGGSDNVQYYMSGGFLDQEGIVKGSSFKRYSLRSNVDVKLSKVFKTGINLNLSRTARDNNDISFTDLIREDPSKPIYDDEGNYYAGEGPLTGFQMSNMLANAELNQDDTFLNRALINTYIQASLFDKIILKSTFSGDFLNSTRNRFEPSTNPTRINNNNRLGGAIINTFNDANLLNENTINYTETFGDHSITALGALTFQTHSRVTNQISANDIPSDGVGVYAVQLAPAESVGISSGYTEDHLIGLIGRVQYAYKNRYVLTASIRRDGSSRLGINERYANFPSVGLAWKLKEESFMQGIDAINSMKLRLTYGKTGNQGAPAFGTLATFGIVNNTILVNGVTVPGVTGGDPANPNLGWEVTSSFDLALEFSLFQSRLSAEINPYYKKTEDLILSEPQLDFTGVPTILKNVGSVQNRGIDVTLSGVIIEKGDFQWDASVNISHYKNEVVDIGRATSIETNRLGAPINDRSGELRVGQPVGIFVGAIYEGYDPLTGEAIYADISGPEGIPDGIYSAEYDDTVIGNANPDFYGGFQTNFKYKFLDLAAFFTFSVGNENYSEEFVRAGGVTSNGFSSIRDNMWSVNNTDALYPKFYDTQNRSSSLFIQDASYLRLATLQLGYTLPSGLLKGITNLRAYVTGTNLLLVKSKDYLGYDPDVNTQSGTNAALQRGYDGNGYPKSRGVLFGVNVTF